MLTETEINTLRELTQRRGFYEVTRTLHTLAAETSSEYTEAGNDGAVVHCDAVELRRAVSAMRLSNPLRMLAG